ncbi:hypothetical protein GXM_06262 [Nostoc sphaeroides CCNUC1]|uniref:Uncharacterized protein n=1 Tax=Nostoc sphaeroides CCNUC1 TaxID=2653204 RepID=A0A5P8W7R4_9NOSO|nr:hypothetical protein GXM_06262 [Nostoc sphaeroides CCNUC1]
MRSLGLDPWCDRKSYSNTVQIRFFDDTPLIVKTAIYRVSCLTEPY